MTQKRPGAKSSGMRSRNTAGRPRQGVASRELQEARRKRRQREVMRNRIILGVGILVVLILVIFLIVKLIGAALGMGGAADASTITFEKDGSVVFEEVTDFDKETYSKSELKSYTQDLIESFNESYGSEAIKLNKIKNVGDKIYVKTTYEDAKAYEAFSSYSTFNGSYDKAVEAGYHFDEVFSVVADKVKAAGSAVDDETLFADMQVAIVDENVTVVVPGEITYVSEPSTEIVDDDTVSIKQADGNDDSSDLVYIIYSAK